MLPESCFVAPSLAARGSDGGEEKSCTRSIPAVLTCGKQQHRHWVAWAASQLHVMCNAAAQPSARPGPPAAAAAAAAAAAERLSVRPGVSTAAASLLTHRPADVHTMKPLSVGASPLASAA